MDEGKVSDIILNNNTYIPLFEDIYDNMEIVLIEYNYMIWINNYNKKRIKYLVIMMRMIKNKNEEN